MERTARGLLTRGLATIALVVFYGLSTLGISSFVMGTPKAEARGRGRGGRGGGRGRGGRRGGGRIGRGRRGRGVWVPGFYGYYDGCYWSPRRGRWVCPYPYW